MSSSIIVEVLFDKTHEQIESVYQVGAHGQAIIVAVRIAPSQEGVELVAGRDALDDGDMAVPDALFPSGVRGDPLDRQVNFYETFGTGDQAASLSNTWRAFILKSSSEVNCLSVALVIRFRSFLPKPSKSS